MARPKLSKTRVGKNWLNQFNEQEQSIAASLLDALLLLNDEQVAAAVRSLLVDDLATQRTGKRKRVALYAEREVAEQMAFKTQLIPYRSGKKRKKRRRAVGKFAAVKPIRASGRVGSEGWLAFVISQAVAAKSRIFLNHPGPDRFRNEKNPVGAIAIATDFIGSGTRISTMLDKFWNVPTIKSWVSRGLIEFIVIAAAGTKFGIDAVKGHVTHPDIRVRHIVPTIDTFPDESRQQSWIDLLKAHTPEDADDEGFGYKGTGALLALTYRIPNNVPKILQNLYTGGVSEDSRSAFQPEESKVAIETLASNLGVEIADEVRPQDAQLVLALVAMGSKWRPGAEYGIAEATGLTLPELDSIRERAVKTGLLTIEGRLTDSGHAAVESGTRSRKKRPDIPTSVEPYYPHTLRVPRGRI